MPRDQHRVEEPRATPARVVEALPNALFRVELQTDSRPLLVVHLAAEAGLLRVLPGETVLVEIAAFAGNRGRIVGRPQ